MPDLLFATTNSMKLNLAQSACQPLGITIVAKPLDIPEIQSLNAKEIVLDKAIKAYELTQQPVLVSDDSWSIPALNGFPGPYMHSINDWLSTESWLDLTRPLSNKKILLLQLLAFTDGSQTKIFENIVEGTILTEARGGNGMGSMSIISLADDEGKSLTEIYESNITKNQQASSIYREFTKWFMENET